MGKGIYVATSGSVAQLRHLEILSNNLANARTSGFKADRANFETVRAQHHRDAPTTTPDPEGLDKHYVDVHAVGAKLDPGPLTRTDNPLDVAITGNGFLTVQTEQGARLTRNGRLLLARDGTLRTMAGHAVLDPSGRTIRLPPDRVPEIDERGVIRTNGAEVGRLGVQTVDLQRGLAKDGDGLFIPPDRGAAPSIDTVVMQGHVEESNVQPVQMMLELIEVQRTFSALRQVISTSGELDSLAARLPQ